VFLYIEGVHSSFVFPAVHRVISIPIFSIGREISDGNLWGFWKNEKMG
jgi:hypothetical protein